MRAMQSWLCGALLVVLGSGCLLPAASRLVAATEMTPVALSTGGRMNPIGIAQEDAVFGWNLAAVSPTLHNLRQSASRIVVADSAQAIAMHVGDVWDSGRVASQVYW